MVDHSLNWKAHWSTDTAFVVKQGQLFLMQQAADTPTKDLPAPQGKTIMPDLAQPAKIENQRNFNINWSNPKTYNEDLQWQILPRIVQGIQGSLSQQMKNKLIFVDLLFLKFPKYIYNPAIAIICFV